jgi:signal peptidase II
MTNARLTGFAVALILFLADQAMKAYVVGVLGLDVPGEAYTVLPIFDFRFVQNVGVSLGMLRAESDAMRWALVALTGVIAVGVGWWMLRERNRVDLIALGLVLGGALGNILDRVRLGYVVDYADLHFGEWQPFLVFNVADAAITIGVLILLARALFVREKPAPRESINA